MQTINRSFAACLLAGAILGPLAGNTHAAIAQRGTANTTANNANNSTTITLTTPTGVAQGDMLIVCLTKSSPNGTTEFTGLSGWTRLQSATLAGQSGQTGRGGVFYKVAGAGEPGTYQFTLGGTPVSSVGGIVAFSGVDTNTGPLDVTSPGIWVSSSSTATGCSASNLTTVTANDAIVMLGMGNSPNSATTWSGWTTTSPGSLTELFDASTGSGVDNLVTVGGAWAIQSSAGTTGSGAATLSVGCRNGGILIALKPAVTAVANATNSTVTASPASVPADGASNSTITVTLKDSGNNPVPGKTVTLASSRTTNDAISVASGASDSSGVVTFTVNSAVPGSSVYTATDVTDNIVVTQRATVVYVASALRDILAFGTNYVASSAAIDTNAATVAWTVPYGTAVTNLAPAYTVSPLAFGSPVSGTTRNFTTPQTYTITAQNGSTKVYTVTVVVAPASSAKDILTFGGNYAGSSAAIDTNAATVAWTVPYGTAITNLAPAYTVSLLASGAPVSGTTRNFTAPQTYTITAQDGSTKTYTVTVTVAPASSLKDMVTFGTNYTGSATINTNAATVTWNLPNGTAVTNLAPAYTVSPYASGSPVSGTTRNFTTPQVYVITAQDGSTKNYTVTAVVAVGQQNYAISLATDVAQEFSPLNRSGHPIVTGLSNYVNSIAPRALLAGALKAPWNVNVGNQTMMCSDCHDTTTTNYVASVAQGPHGSANQFLLRGPNAANWPNTTSFASSWCANCHLDNLTIDGGHGGHHGVAGCYACHIVIPHGGKVSRLIGDRDTMPARYAYANNLTNMQIQQFIKTNASSYLKDNTGNCSAACATGDHPATLTRTAENW